MNKKQVRFIIRILHGPAMAWFVLFISLTLTISAYIISSNTVKQRAKDRFEFKVKEIELAIEERLRVYEQQLWSVAGLMYASSFVDRSEFGNFVETMDVEKHWPGIQGIGFSIPLTPAEKEAHIASVQAEGFPEYTIKPEGERDMYSAIIYLEPFDWRNQRAFGYDMWSNPVRREAMTRARDQGVAATSGKITLVQETEADVQAGFLTYVPIYTMREIPETVEERRMNFKGWVYAPFRAGNLMQGILGISGADMEFEVYDGEQMSLESLLFDTDGRPHLQDEAHAPAYEKVVQVTNQGRTWTLYLSTSSGFLDSSDQNQPRFVALAGAVVDVLLFYVIWALYFINRKAEDLADEMTHELQHANQRLEDTVHERTAQLEKARDSLESKVMIRTEELAQKVRELERINEAMVGREVKMIELKKEIEDLKERLRRTQNKSGS